MNNLKDKEQAILDKKVAELNSTSKHLGELHTFCKTEIGQQDTKIAGYISAIETKKVEIKELRRIIVKYE